MDTLTEIDFACLEDMLLSGNYSTRGSSIAFAGDTPVDQEHSDSGLMGAFCTIA